MRTVLLALAGLVLGALIGGTIANVTIPSREQMRQFAVDLVPPGADPTGVGAVSGLEMFVGPYEAIARFDTRGADVATVGAVLREHAAKLGWTHVRTEPKPAGEQQFWTRESVRATVSIYNPGLSEGSVIFVRYAASPTDRFLIGLVAGGAVGLILALLIPRFVLRPRTSTT